MYLEGCHLLKIPFQNTMNFEAFLNHNTKITHTDHVWQSMKTFAFPFQYDSTLTAFRIPLGKNEILLANTGYSITTQYRETMEKAGLKIDYSERMKQSYKKNKTILINTYDKNHIFCCFVYNLTNCVITDFLNLIATIQDWMHFQGRNCCYDL